MYFSANSLQTLANSGKLREESCVVREFNFGLCIFNVKVCKGLKILKNDCHFIPSVISITAKSKNSSKSPCPCLR